MAIRPEALESPERGMDLMTRPVMVADPEPALDDLADELRHRIAAARQMVPASGVGCRDCWHRGRDAALAMIAAAVDGDDVRARLETARTLRPSSGELHWLACWEGGRDAAIEALEGE